MKIYILRHGETEWNKLKRLQGRSDIPLDEKGEALARMTGEGMRRAGLFFDACVSSPLSRARRTAELVLGVEPAGAASGHAQKHWEGMRQAVPIALDERIAEVNLGPWEGHCMIDDPRFPKADPEAFVFFQSPELARVPQGAETYSEVIERTGAFLRDIAKQYQNYQGKPFNLSAEGLLERSGSAELFREHRGTSGWDVEAAGYGSDIRGAVKQEHAGCLTIEGAAQRGAG